METGVQAPPVTDLDWLYSFEAAAKASVTAYATAAVQTYDAAVRERFMALAGLSLISHGKARQLIERLGGET